MGVGIDYSDHTVVINELKASQEAEHDMREQVREQQLFVTKRDGQWDPYATEKLKGRYRGTFDMVTPVIDQIAGEMDSTDFTLRVRPSGGDSSKGTAKVFDGIIRNIRNISNAEHTFSAASRSVVTAGLDGWEIVQDWVDADAFEQDLFIRKVPNFVDRVWFDQNSEEQDRSDANWCVILQTVGKAEYDERWPEGSSQSVGEDRSGEAYFNKAEFVVVGKLYWKKPVDINLVQMTNGAVYRDDEKFEKVKDELAQVGVTVALDDKGEEKRRTRKSWRVHSRLFDGGGWLNEPQETVFDFLPVVVMYGNFNVVENKTVYSGKTNKLIDAQRVFNYAMSRDTEEGALAPRAKYWMTREQAEKDISTLATMNTNSNPVQTYSHVEGQPPPFWQGGAQVNPGLQTTISTSKALIGETAGMFGANMGANPGLQSGVALEAQIGQGNNSSVKWFTAAEIAICYTGKVLLNAIPRVYDSTRQVRLVADDGTVSLETINTKVLDSQTGEPVELNDLSKGQYDVVCEVGPAFKSQQRETAEAFVNMAQIDPNLIAENQDVWLGNLQTPGMDIAAERARKRLINQGVVPPEQWTDEERQEIEAAQAAAANQPPQEDPAMVLARAEEGKAQADIANAQTSQQEAQFKAQIEAAKVQLEQEKVALEREKLQLDAQKFQLGQSDKFNVDAAKISQGQQDLDLKREQQAQSLQQQQFDQLMESQRAIVETLSTQAQTMKVLREALGADSFIGPGTTSAVVNQSRVVAEAQADQGADLPITDLPDPQP